MTRCSAKTLSGKRCKKTVSHDGKCMIHIPPLITPENDPETAPVGMKRCKHVCSNTTIFCCSCSDLRPLDTVYYRYFDILDDLPVGKRNDGYCCECKPSTELHEGYEHLSVTYVATIDGMSTLLSKYKSQVIAQIVGIAMKKKRMNESTE